MAVVSKVELTDEEQRQRKEQAVRSVKLASFLAVCQHVVTLQSEPQLVDAMCGGDVARSAQLLASTSGLVGILSIICNQIGGKLSDSVGRKPALLLGPLCNIALGSLVYLKHKSLFTVLACRTLRMVFTTFSNTVINQAVLSDVLSGQELSVVGSQILAIVGLAVSVTPFVEGTVLARTRNPRLTFLLLSALASVQLLFTSGTVETLDPEKRAPLSNAMNLASLNPFGFTKIFTHGTPALQKNVVITTLQGFIEGKNLSDFGLAFMKENMGWSVTDIRNWVSVYGATNVLSGITVTPYLLKQYSVRAYTSITNWTNILAYILRAFVERRNWLYIGTVPLMLPGVNGVSSTALKSVAAAQADLAGFGKAEFAAYSNNLRAIISAVAPILMTNAYVVCHRKGFAGATYWIIGIVAAVVPELLLQRLSDEELAKTSK